MSLDEKIPRINWPEESGEYKVVQLDIDGQLYLRFGENWAAHLRILMDALESLGVEYERAALKLPQGERYKIHGMGLSRVDVEQKKASFYGYSLGYGIRIDAQHLEAMRQLAPDWKVES